MAATACGSYHRAGALDLSPPAECIGTNHAYEQTRKHARTNIVDFEDLIGAADGDASTLFTCARQHSAPPPRAPYTHERAPATSTTSHLPALSLSDVGIGMPISGRWLVGNTSDSRPLNELCAAGERLACARHTWMADAGPSLDVLLLADCSTLHSTACAGPLAARGVINCTETAAAAATASLTEFGPFPFARASWLVDEAAMPKLHVSCYWGAYKGLGLSFWKSAVLFRGLFERLKGKRYYLKVDADAILRPHNLMQFLGFLHVRLVPGSAVYFGSTFGSYACTGVDRQGDQCRAFTFNKDYSTSVKRSSKTFVRLRESHEWNEVQRTMLSSSGNLLANRTAVTYALGGVYGLSAAALSRLVRSQCQQRVGHLRCGRVPCSRTVQGSALHSHEDANMGLCMHLNGVRLLQCSCFHMMNMAAKYRRAWNVPMSVGANESAMSAEQVVRYFQDGQPDRSRAPQLCQHPIAVHPIRKYSEYLRVWSALNVRDAVNARALEAWRREARGRGRA